MRMSENEHYSRHGLALTQEEQEDLKRGGLEFTGWYNQHEQPILRGTKTGKELPLCRMGYLTSITCGGVKWVK